MVDINLIYKSNSDYMKAEDIGTNMWTMTIANADLKEFDNGDRKIVLQFDDFDKSLPLNVTNARAIADLYGGDTDKWVGRQIMLFTMPVDYQGKMVQAVRVRAPQQQTRPQSRSQQGGGNRQSYDERNPPPRQELNDEVSF